MPISRQWTYSMPTINVWILMDAMLIEISFNLCHWIDSWQVMDKLNSYDRKPILRKQFWPKFPIKWPVSWNQEDLHQQKQRQHLRHQWSESLWNETILALSGMHFSILIFNGICVRLSYVREIYFSNVNHAEKNVVHLICGCMVTLGNHVNLTERFLSWLKYIN